MIWSPVKQTVFDFEHDIVVSAGAGSGKTAVLVELYLRLLAGETSLPHPLSVEEVAAITFTDKAAVEMKERVRQGILARISRNDSAADWHGLLRSLPHAVISTFHSLCSRILREHPVEAEIDPSFGLLDDLAAQGELEAALDELVEGELRSRTTDIRLLLRHFPLSGAGRCKGVREHLAELVRKRSGGSTADGAIAAATARWNERARQSFDERYRELTKLADEMERILRGKRLTFHEKLQRLHQLVTQERLAPGDEGTAQLLDTMEQCVGGNWGKEKEVKDKLLQCLAALQDCCWQLRSAPVAEALLNLASRLASLYALRKERRGALDFDDLQLKTRDLLHRNPVIRAEYRQRFAVLMVDEFQDTNRLQKELVELLCGEEQRLFVVGDPKQSIYLFRGAEVAVFGQIQAEIAAAGGSTLYFQECFRSREGIIRFVNRLFGDVVMTGGEESDAAYRAGDHLIPHRLDWDGSPCVELLQIEDQGNSAELRCSEAAMVARKIADITAGAGGVTVFDKGSATGRVPRYGDIAVLFRRFSNVKQFERELRRHGIPYYVVKGKGFYRCQEILDIMNFLMYLESSRELISLAGILRSPLCGISDETLYFLSTAAGGLANWQQTVSVPEFSRKITNEDMERLRSLSLLIDRLRPLRDRLTLPELLEDILVGTDFTSTLLTTFQGEQKAANLRKLIELSRSFTDGGSGSLHRFISWLKNLVATEPTEAEAVVSAEGENVVRLMTVHQSKGLEFPVVFIPEIGGNTPAMTAPVAYDDDLGLGLRLALPGGESRPSLAFREIAALRKAKEAAELKRLLYVAVTRARDFLVVSGEGKGEWRTWFEAFRSIDGGELLKITPVFPISEPGSAASPCIPAPIPAVPPDAMALAVERALRYRPPLPADMTFSPTALEDYLNCPRKYYYKRVIGLDEALFNQLLLPHGAGQGDASPRMSALDKGNLAHAILELFDFSAGTAERQSLCRAISSRIASHQPAEDVNEVIERVLAFAASPRGKSLAGLTLRRELPFTLKLKGEATYFIKGAMDLVAESPSHAAVYDYKYVEKERADLEGYRFQLRVYMLALAMAHPGKKIEGSLLFLKGNGEEPVEFDGESCAALLVETMDAIRRRQAESDFALRLSCDGGHCPFHRLCRTPLS